MHPITKLMSIFAAGFASAAYPGQPQGGSWEKGRPAAQIREEQRRDSVQAIRKARNEEAALAALLDTALPEAAPDSCLAYLKATGECLVPFPAFRDRMRSRLSHPGQARPAADSAAALRRRVMDELLDEAFREGAANPFLEEAEAAVRAEKRQDARRAAAGRDREELTRLYREHLPGLVRGDPRIRFEVYAATDSAFLDSLGRKLPAPGGLERGDSARRARGDTEWLPTVLPPAAVPDEWIRRAASLAPGTWDGPRRTAWGFVLLRSNRPFRSLQESLPVLARLRQLATGPDSGVMAARVREQYARHPELFLSPDTLRIQVRLLPRPARLRQRSGLRREAGDTLLGAALAGVRPSRVTQQDLPPEARRAAQELRPPCRPGSPEPFFADFGFWSLCVEKAAPGAGRTPFASAAGPIRERLEARDRDSLLAAATAVQRGKEGGQAAERARRAWLEALAGQADPGETDSAAALRAAEQRLLALKARWIAESVELATDP